MHLYLVQHAEAKKEEEDPLRSLTDKGTHDIKKVASNVVKLKLKVANIYHSGKTRALQTAQILHKSVDSSGGISQTDGLSPMDEPGVWAERLGSIKDNIILVGHLPHLSKLASLLVAGDEGKDVVNVQKASIVCLQRFDDGHWAVDWMLTPEIC
ncbi:MAG: phosphohistidine phosphatase SixA [Dissulfurispiraceae bacterium]